MLPRHAGEKGWVRTTLPSSLETQLHDHLQNYFKQPLVRVRTDAGMDPLDGSFYLVVKVTAPGLPDVISRFHNINTAQESRDIAEQRSNKQNVYVPLPEGIPAKLLENNPPQDLGFFHTNSVTGQLTGYRQSSIPGVLAYRQRLETGGADVISHVTVRQALDFFRARGYDVKAGTQGDKDTLVYGGRRFHSYSVQDANEQVINTLLFAADKGDFVICSAARRTGEAC